MTTVILDPERLSLELRKLLVPIELRAQPMLFSDLPYLFVPLAERIIIRYCVSNKLTFERTAQSWDVTTYYSDDFKEITRYSWTPFVVEDRFAIEIIADRDADASRTVMKVVDVKIHEVMRK